MIGHTQTATTGKLWKDEKHSHFWIEDGALFESYHTIRGLRYRYRMAVPLMSDCDKLSDSDIFYIETHFCK